MAILLLRDVDRFDTVDFTVTFRNSSGVLTDPGTVTFYLEDPTGIETSYVYGSDSEVTKVGTGVYGLSFQPDTSGRWSVLCRGQGTVDQTTQGRIQVNRDPFTIS